MHPSLCLEPPLVPISVWPASLFQRNELRKLPQVEKERQSDSQPPDFVCQGSGGCLSPNHCFSNQTLTPPASETGVAPAWQVHLHAPGQPCCGFWDHSHFTNGPRAERNDLSRMAEPRPSPNLNPSSVGRPLLVQEDCGLSSPCLLPRSRDRVGESGWKGLQTGPTLTWKPGRPPARSPGLPQPCPEEVPSPPVAPAAPCTRGPPEDGHPHFPTQPALHREGLQAELQRAARGRGHLWARSRCTFCTGLRPALSVSLAGAGGGEGGMAGNTSSSATVAGRFLFAQLATRGHARPSDFPQARPPHPTPAACFRRFICQRGFEGRVGPLSPRQGPALQLGLCNLTL